MQETGKILMGAGKLTQKVNARLTLNSGYFFKNEKISTPISLKHGLDFLPYLFQKGNNYSLISAAQSILPYFLRYYG